MLTNRSLIVSMPQKRLSRVKCKSPLAHFHIHHSASSRFQIHPFTTITYLKQKQTEIGHDEGYIDTRFLFREMEAKDRERPPQPSTRKRKQWTSRLASLADEEHQMGTPGIATLDAKPSSSDRSSARSLSLYSLAESEQSVDLRLRLEGPYFTAANPMRYKTVLCLVAGTGVTGAMAIAAAFRAHEDCEKCSQSSNRETAEAKIASNNSSLECRERWRRCIIIWSVRESEYVDVAVINNGARSLLHLVFPIAC